MQITPALEIYPSKRKKMVKNYIKLQDHEKRKPHTYKEDIGKRYNMTYSAFEDEHYYICHDGRQLRYIRTVSSLGKGVVICMAPIATLLDEKISWYPSHVSGLKAALKRVL